jgi:hypothetical protein
VNGRHHLLAGLAPTVVAGGPLDQQRQGVLDAGGDREVRPPVDAMHRWIDVDPDQLALAGPSPAR